jgi:hypothetical protein
MPPEQPCSILPTAEPTRLLIILPRLRQGELMAAPPQHQKHWSRSASFAGSRPCSVYSSSQTRAGSGGGDAVVSHLAGSKCPPGH